MRPFLDKLLKIAIIVGIVYGGMWAAPAGGIGLGFGIDTGNGTVHFQVQIGKVPAQLLIVNPDRGSALEIR